MEAPTLDAAAAASLPQRPRPVADSSRARSRASLVGVLTIAFGNGALLLLLHVVTFGPLSSVYTSGYRALFVLAAAVGLAVGSVGRVWRLPAWVSAAAATVGLVVIVGGLASDDTVLGVVPTPGSIGDAVRGATAGWKDLLTVGSPSEPSGSLLAGPLAAVYASAVLAAELSHRRRSAAAALAPPLVLWVVFLGLGGPRSGFAMVSAVIGLALCLGYLAFRAALPGGSRQTSTQPVSASWVLVAIPLVLGITVFGGVVGSALPLRADDADRADLRGLVDPPISVQDLVTPLASVAPQLDGDAETVLFTVSLSGVGADLVDRVPIARLDEYDGAVWRNSASFPRPGARLSEPAAVEAVPLRMEVELADGYRASFLPSLGRPTAYDGPAVGFDPETATLVGGADLVAYAIDGEVLDPATSGPALERANATSSESADRFLALPDELPESLVDLARSVEDASETTTGRLFALADELSGRGLNPQARSSHTLARLDAYVGGGDDEFAAEVGTAEQGAAAFAVVARQLGVPARVAVGYRLGTAEDGVISVAPTDAHAWPEVLLADLGWVAFDAAPTSFQPLDEETAPAIGPSEDLGDETDLEEPGLEEDPEAELAAPVAAPEEIEPGDGPPWLLLVGALVVVSLIAGPPGLKFVRRRRRRRGDESKRVLGATAELRDRMLERGLPASRSLTVGELISTADGALSPDAAAAGSALGPIADLALYSPTGASVVDASRAWELESEFESALDDGLLARVRHGWDPRPLVAGRGSRGSSA